MSYRTPLLTIALMLAGCELPEVVERNCAERQPFFPDADGDGIGEPTDVFIGCEAPDGWVSIVGTDGTPTPTPTDTDTDTIETGDTSSDTSVTPTGDTGDTHTTSTADTHTTDTADTHTVGTGDTSAPTDTSDTSDTGT